MVDPRTLRTHPEMHSHRSFPVFRALGEQPKSPLERVLSLFADVRAGEGLGAILMAVNVFLLLGAYYLLKPAREALILTESGAEVKSYSAAAQAIVLLGVIPVYGWVSTRVNRLRLLNGLTLFFAMNLVLFWIFGMRGAREGVVFYIWLGIFNMLIVSQFWAFANDIYTEGQGRRLFPLIGVGMSIGALVGAVTVGALVKQLGWSPYTLMLAAGGVLVVCTLLTTAVNVRETGRAEPEAAKEAVQPLGTEGGFQLVFRDRYLFWIAVLVVLLNVVNTTGGYLLDKVVIAQAAAHGGDAKRFIGEFYANFLSAVNLLGLLLQAFAASRLIRLAGVRGALFVLPVLALISYSVMAVAPVLMVVRWTKLLENATDYSIMNTVRQALWLPTSREAKYKAKAAVDSFWVRGGDVLQAGIVFVGVSIGAGLASFAWLNVALTVAWLYAASQVAKEHRKRTV